MAIKIIKHGKESFKATCPICGCEFSYQAEDLKEDRFHNHYVECPDCKQIVSHEYEFKNKSITLAKCSPTVDYKLSYPYLQNTAWATTTSWPDCDICPNKPDPNKIVVGDTPCTWCKKNQLYCILDNKCMSESYIVNKTPKSYSQADYKYTTDTKE